MRRTTMLTFLLALTLTLPSLARAGADEAFVKLDGTGQEMDDQATDWHMVLDKTTGLTWEIKSADGSLHDRNNLYSWKNILKTFIKGLNEEGFGGYNDWRLPSEHELGRLQKIKEDDPARFEKYFPRTAPSTYWTWSRCQDGSKNSLRLKFGDQPSEQERQHRIRAVRGELKE